MTPGQAPSRSGATLRVVSRVLAVVVVGYGFSAAVATFGTLALMAGFGFLRSEAVQLSAMTGFLLYLAVLIWGFAERSLLRVWSVLSAGACLAGGLAWALYPVATGSMP